MSKAYELMLAEACKQYSEEYHILVVPEDLARSFLSMGTLDRDLQHARLYYEKVLDEKLSEHDSMTNFIASLTYYKRCYAESAGYSQLNKYEVYKGDADLLDFHEKMCAIRDKFLAHKGENEFEESAVFILLNKKDKHRRIKLMHSLNFKMIDEEIHLYGRLIKKSEDYVSKALKKRGSHLLKEYIARMKPG
jgi:hypothetical protein